MNLILLGKPGAGKGYISDFLEKEYGFYHISTGDLCRKNVKEKTEIGAIIDNYTKKGLLVPLDIILKMLKREIELHQNENIIFDGFPRNVEQAKELKNIANIDAVLLVDVPDTTILERIAKRRICPVCSKMYSTDETPNGKCLNCNNLLQIRADDNLDVAKNRLIVYEKETKPLVDFYKERLIKIDNSGKFEDTVKILKSSIDKIM